LRERRADVLIVGGGLGGVAAAIAAAGRGLDVVMSEPTDWIGGQLTSQAVPPDEHPWIETHGCTATYRALRDDIRAYYRERYPLTDAARAVVALNPGACFVSRLGHEPRVALAVLEAMLPASVEVRLEHAPVAAEVEGDRVVAVTLRGGGEDTVVVADWVLDAGECGDLLPLCGAEHGIGFEATGEPHAPSEDQPGNLQPVTVCFAVDHLAGEDHTIPRPARYEEFAPRFSWVAPDPQTNEPVERRFAPNPDEDPLAIGPDFSDPDLDKDLWRFRRIAARGLFAPGAYASDITLVNWPQVDYPDEVVLDGRAAGARELSLSFLHWMQTEAGFPGLRLRGDVVGDTPDGLAKHAYIREPRRLRAVTTVLEQHLTEGPARFPDSVGIGAYRIDLHPSTGGDPSIDLDSHPFEIPLGALVPVRLENLVAAGKAIGTTHITNGAYRLHPVEWNIGEAAGHLVAHCAARGTRPREVQARPEELQHELEAAGVELHWPTLNPPKGV
jgi:FAD dependent oxidoreductase